MSIRERLTEESCIMLGVFIDNEGRDDIEIARATGKKPVNVRAHMRFFDLMGWGKIRHTKYSTVIVINDDIKARAKNEGIVS